MRYLVHRSLRNIAAIYDEGVAGYEGGCMRAEPDHCFGDIFRLPKSSEWDL